jgi:sulfur carrier protein
MIEVKINGNLEKLSPGTTVSAVLEAKKVRPEIVAVEVNGELVPKGNYAALALKPGDQMEFLHYMAGGTTLRPTCG